jgi:hypothetical protein
VKRKPPLTAFISLFLLSMPLLVFCAVPVHAELVWDIQVVDENASGIGYGYCPIVVDADNNPHIAYSGAPKMRYASWNGTGWNIQQIEYASAHDLALDADGNPHITFGSLAYASWTGTDWDIQTVTTNHTVYSSLALDSSGNPHIAYITGNELQYANQNEANWNIQTVTVDDNLPDIDPALSLALDSNDTPYIMYYTPSSYVDNSTGEEYRSVNVKLAVWKNSSWNIETVLASSNFFDFGNMVLDSKGYPHFLATQLRFSAVLHVSWDGSAWNIQTVASNVSLRNIGFLALGPDDLPNIIYMSEQMMYARWTGQTWETQPVGTASTSNSRTYYLAVDSNGNPHISSIEDRAVSPYDRRNLLYATVNATEPAEATPTPEVTPTFPDSPLLIVASAVIIGTVIAVTVYVWKKKTRH